MKKLTLVLVGLFISGSLVGCSHHKHHRKHHKKMWKMMDENKDGKVSKAEYDKAHDHAFKMMDTNGDGVISKEEKMSCKKAKKKACHMGKGAMKGGEEAKKDEAKK